MSDIQKDCEIKIQSTASGPSAPFSRASSESGRKRLKRSCHSSRRAPPNVNARDGSHRGVCQCLVKSLRAGSEDQQLSSIFPR